MKSFFHTVQRGPRPRRGGLHECVRSKSGNILLSTMNNRTRHASPKFYFVATLFMSKGSDYQKPPTTPTFFTALLTTCRLLIHGDQIGFYSWHAHSGWNGKLSNALIIRRLYKILQLKCKRQGTKTHPHSPKYHHRHTI